jgi:hypothetical protein
MEMTDAERQFLEAVRLHGSYTRDRNFPATNPAYDRAAKALRAVRSQPDRGERFLLACLADPDPSVVAWAASSLLPDKRAIEALKHVACGDDFVAFDAEMILEEWRAGRFKPE